MVLPVWKTHSPAMLFASAPKLMPLNALPSDSSRTQIVGLVASDCVDGVTGGAGPPFGGRLVERERGGLVKSDFAGEGMMGIDRY